MIAALYVEEGGCYFNLRGVDPWPQNRDARRYPGPFPVVAHPPCQRWGKFWAGSPLVIAKTGKRKIKGDDNGCFAAALAHVRKFGGVIEHPWASYAWPHFGIAVPPRTGGWIIADEFGGFTCCVEQGRYGHLIRKPTLLLAYNCDLPKLSWGISEPTYPQRAIDRYGLERCKKMGEMAFIGGGVDNSQRNGTPIPFRDLLIAMANSVYRQDKVFQRMQNICMTNEQPRNYPIVTMR